ncbi:esterase family protein [Chitinophaga polysaccharea]|uniref:alpha/beta hydrolase n=1 Tax=Chitinophaga TaxID=79328 RepID=UPI00145525A3|nr:MULTISPECIES: alpha/beta hydrolase family protein [Chitinophaga]NLR61199.1 esterase family protein [Chitinophaga polysaccharea]NLU95035.1 esterase family protein [Chitinophaga sp. Ak27]
MKLFARLLIFVCYAQVAKAANVDTVSIYSQKMHRAYNCVVITPSTYKSGTQRYPVVYLLHGAGGNYANWVTKVPAIKELVDTYQCMVVCPDGAVTSWYFDSPVDSSMRFESYVSTEIPAYIDQHYQTMPEPHYRAITGLSMGGHGAMFLAIRHPEVFGAAGSISGGVDLRPFPKNWDIAKRLGPPGVAGANWTDYTVIKQVEKLKPGVLSIIIDCGVKDFFIDVNRDLHKKLLLAGIDHDYTERPGEHNWDYWANSIQYQLLFFHRFFQ